MKKKLKLELKVFADDLAKKYSNTQRAKNYDDDFFYVIDYEILSEYTAIVVFGKSSGKKAMALVWYIEAGTGGFFQYFFPKDQHINAFDRGEIYKKYKEISNYNFMLDEKKKNSG